MYKIPIIALCVLLTASMAGNIYQRYFKNDTTTQQIPWPGESQWTEVVTNKYIKIVSGETLSPPAIKYDIDASTVTIDRFFGRAIPWKDGEFVNIATYNPMSSGASITRVHLPDRRIVYFTQLYGIGPVDHSQYGNSLKIYTNRDLVMFVGDESAGAYREIRRISDGSLILIDQKYKDFSQTPCVQVH